MLSTEEEEEPKHKETSLKREREFEEPATCSALQVDFLQGVSQQLLQAQVGFVSVMLWLVFIFISSIEAPHHF